MSKQSIRDHHYISQEGTSIGTDTPLDRQGGHLHRKVPKTRGGPLTITNTDFRDPREHTQKHCMLRDRPEEFKQIKAIFDDRQQCIKVKNKVENQILADERYSKGVEHITEETKQFLLDNLKPVKKRIGQLERRMEKELRATKDPLIESAYLVVGISTVTIAGLSVYVDLEKAPNASSLWAYTGLDVPAGARYGNNKIYKEVHEEYKKRIKDRREMRGVEFYLVPDQPSGDEPELPKGWGGSKVLRTVLFNAAKSIEKNRKSPYHAVYEETKSRLEVSKKKVYTFTGKESGYVEKMWKDVSKGHRQGAALRQVMKHILADYWYVGREIMGLPVRPPYAIEKLGHVTWIKPEARGWIWSPGEGT